MTNSDYPNIQEIFDLMQKTPTAVDKKWLQKAYDFAKQAHAGQKRANGDPYFYHAFEVAKNLIDFRMDRTTIIAGFLHDVIEDTSVTEDELENQFGKEVVFLVNGVTKLGTLKYKGAKRHVESLRKFFVAMAEDSRVLIIKLADRLHNLRTLEFIPRPDKRKRIALESIEIHAPLANRLGMWKLKSEIEDLAFPFAYPEENQQVKDLLKQKSHTTQKYLEQVYKSLRKELAKNNIEVDKASYRMKGVYSLYKKLKKKDMDIDKIYDIVALRVIVPNVEDCYRVLGIIHSLWRPLPGRIKDFIAIPKPNGYKSIHTTIFTGNGGISEIQIRTPEMHQEAEYGIASHFAYKKKKYEKKIKETTQWIPQLSELQESTSDPENFIDNLRLDFFNKRIFAFTPNGDVIDLPENSCAIDFAFSVHSDIGMHASAANINGKNSKLETKLKNGDIVRIETNKKSKPSTKWLDYVKTTLAKRHIKTYLGENSLMDKFMKRFK
ncbi:MAG: guanosine-3',5'-bis(diphosphate) 3'-pyrophosphohydrolase [Candidatus Paceibacteria bacterium]|jgi:guanosine-3',5'-bis(diphosphate) 3'-pyrophosphohydrolase